MPAGQPTKFKPEYCGQVIVLGKEGKSCAEFACAFKVSKQTIFDWAKEFPEFSDALACARSESESWWVSKGREGLVLPKAVAFQQSVWTKAMACMFRGEWSDATKIEHSGSIAPKEPGLSRLTDAELDAYIALQAKLEGPAGE